MLHLHLEYYAEVCSPQFNSNSAIGKDPEASHKNDQNYIVASMHGANKLGFFSLQKPDKWKENTTEIYKLVSAMKRMDRNLLLI